MEFHLMARIGRTRGPPARAAHPQGAHRGCLTRLCLSAWRPAHAPGAGPPGSPAARRSRARQPPSDTEVWTGPGGPGGIGRRRRLRSRRPRPGRYV